MHSLIYFAFIPRFLLFSFVDLNFPTFHFDVCVFFVADLCYELLSIFLICCRTLYQKMLWFVREYLWTKILICNTLEISWFKIEMLMGCWQLTPAVEPASCSGVSVMSCNDTIFAVEWCIPETKNKKNFQAMRWRRKVVASSTLKGNRIFFLKKTT